MTVGEDLGSDHLPITIDLRCQTPVASDPHKRARWNTRDVNWQAFSEAVEESVRSFQVQDMYPRHRIHRLNRAMIFAAAKHVGKSKPGRKTKPWSTPALRDAIKQRNTLSRAMQSNRVEYLAACGEVRRLSEEARRAKWDEGNLEGNPDQARAWKLIKSLSGSSHSTAFCKPLIHNGYTAFDRVWREERLLAASSKGLPIPFTRWLRDFLSNCAANIQINGDRGDSAPLRQGLPQGSVMSPLLFLLCIDGLCSVMPETVKVALFADDFFPHQQSPQQTSRREGATACGHRHHRMEHLQEIGP